MNDHDEQIELDDCIHFPQTYHPIETHTPLDSIAPLQLPLCVYAIIHIS